jgi:hypothetical protein
MCLFEIKHILSLPEITGTLKAIRIRLTSESSLVKERSAAYDSGHRPARGV